MIYPSRRAILAAAALAPAALAIGLAAPAQWYAGLALLALLLALIGTDAAIGARPGQAELLVDLPGAVSVGGELEVGLHVRFHGSAPAFAEAAINADPLLVAPGGLRRTFVVAKGAGSVSFAVQARRRGTARLDPLWLRWPGPLGLVWKQRRFVAAAPLLVTPDIRPVRQKAAELIHREMTSGGPIRPQMGEGAEFDALTEYRAGMDRRAIDWKQSARHTSLIAKEYRIERNNQIVLALDAGRAMTEPVAGVPRIDRAVSAALLAAFVALREGDRAGFFAFDSHPRASSGTIAGPGAFPALQRIAAGIDYSSRETNYTLGLATLAAGLQRRSLIVVFTEFADAVGAELMLGAVAPLLRRHLVLFVVMRDEELERFAEAEPREPGDVVRAVTAASLLRERRLVIARLRHLGVHVVEAAHDAVGPALVGAYSGFKRRGLL